MNTTTVYFGRKKGKESHKTDNSCFGRTISAPDLSFLFPVFNQYIVFFSYIYRENQLIKGDAYGINGEILRDKI